MKKVKLILPILILVMFIPFYANAKTCDTDKISISSITVEDKSNNVEELDKATANGKTINLSLSMSEVGDNIKYKVVVKNDSNEDYKIDKNSFNHNSDYIDYILEADDDDDTDIIKANSSKTLYLKAEYKKEVPEDKFESGTFNDNKTMAINLSTGDTINVPATLKNPNTGASLLFLSILIISVVLFIILKKTKVKFMILIIGTAITIPISVYALCTCNINIESKVVLRKLGIKLSSFIESKMLDDDSLFIDDFGNIRYSGKNVNNYVCLEKDNCNISNLYRIIGVFKNIDDGTGKKETRVKIIKATSNGLDYYDTNNKNNWARPASLNTKLQKTSLANSNLIDTALWNLGGSTNATDNAYQYYQTERSENHFNNNPTQWIGKIALMYASDYGYASSECRVISQPLSNYDDDRCTSSNWLLLGKYEWLLNHYTGSPQNAISIWPIGFAIGHSSSDSTTVGENRFNYRSTAFFKANVVMDENSGDGTVQNPYLVSVD